jgi:alpha-tubulin suppressor-like RCC1 family protein
VWCWGANNQNQIGSAANSDSQTAPVQVANLGDVRSLALGHFFSCAVMMDRTMTCWGPNGDGQLGDGTQTDRPDPVAVSGATNVRSASAGQNSACAVFTDRTISCWGANTEGQVGDGTQDGPRLTPTPVATVDKTTQVVAGRNHACALRTSRTVRCWGDNTFGEIGDGTNDVRPTRVAIDLGGPVASIGTGNDHTCAVLLDASVWCWGFNLDGQLGDQTTTDSNVPVRVKGL